VFPLPHQVGAESDEFPVIRALIVGFEPLSVVENQAIAHALQCLVDFCSGG
jgi:hypothetical protein